MRRIRQGILFSILALAVSACAPQHSTYQKRKKKKCDCPSWSQNFEPISENEACLNKDENLKFS